MKIPAAILSLIVALVLLGMAFTAWRDDALNSANRTSEEFQLLHDGSNDVFQQDIADDQARHNTEGIEAVVGAAFLIAGIALFSVSRPKQPQEA